MGPLDTAINAASAAEATYNADVVNVGNIETAITTASAPLAPAQTQLAADATTFNNALQALSTAALASQVTVPPAGVTVPALASQVTVPTEGVTVPTAGG